MKQQDILLKELECNFMLLSKNDLRFFQKHYPDVDFDNAYWSFSSWGGDGHADVMCPGLKSEILYGLSLKGGGGIAELSMQWEPAGVGGASPDSPYLKAFMDATILLASPTHQKLAVKLMKYQESGPTPEQFAKLLVSLGFEDETTRLSLEQEASQ